MRERGDAGGERAAFVAVVGDAGAHQQRGEAFEADEDRAARRGAVRAMRGVERADERADRRLRRRRCRSAFAPWKRGSAMLAAMTLHSSSAAHGAGRIDGAVGERGQRVGAGFGRRDGDAAVRGIGASVERCGVGAARDGAGERGDDVGVRRAGEARGRGFALHAAMFGVEAVAHGFDGEFGERRIERACAGGERSARAQARARASAMSARRGVAVGAHEDRGAVARRSDRRCARRRRAHRARRRMARRRCRAWRRRRATFARARALRVRRVRCVGQWMSAADTASSAPGESAARMSGASSMILPSREQRQRASLPRASIVGPGADALGDALERLA